MIFLVVILLIGAMVTWIMIAPVIAVIDSANSVYEVRQPVTFSVCLNPVSSFQPVFHVLGFRIRPRAKSAEKTKPVKIRKKKSRKKIPLTVYRDLARGLSSAIKMQQCRINVDTGDVMLNAMLFPVLYFTRSETSMFSINFQGEVSFDIRISVLPYRVAWAFLMFNINKYYYGS